MNPGAPRGPCMLPSTLWHDFPLWMYAVLVVVSGWLMSLRREERAERLRAGEAGPTWMPPDEGDRPT